MSKKILRNVKLLACVFLVAQVAICLPDYIVDWIHVGPDMTVKQLEKKLQRPINSFRYISMLSGYDKESWYYTTPLCKTLVGGSDVARNLKTFLYVDYVDSLFSLSEFVIDARFECFVNYVGMFSLNTLRGAIMDALLLSQISASAYSVPNTLHYLGKALENRIIYIEQHSSCNNDKRLLNRLVRKSFVFVMLAYRLKLNFIPTLLDKTAAKSFNSSDEYLQALQDLLYFVKHLQDELQLHDAITFTLDNLETITLKRVKFLGGLFERYDVI